MPEVRLCAPGFDRQPAADADEDNKQIPFEIGSGNDRDRHEDEYANQQPVNVAPPRTTPVHIREIVLDERPPDAEDEKDRDEKSAQQHAAIAGPEFCD